MNRAHSESRYIRKQNNNDSYNKSYEERKQQHVELMEREMKLIEQRRINNNGWNKELEGYIQRLGERAGGFRWMHHKSAGYYNKYYHGISVVSIIFCVAGGTFNIPALANGCASSTYSLMLLATTFMYLIGVLQGIQQFKNYGSRQSLHTTAEANYSALYHNIRGQLSINRKDRQIGKDYLEWISKESDDLKAASPSIPNVIFTQYKEMIKDTNLAIVDEIETIEIKEETPPRILRAEDWDIFNLRSDSPVKSKRDHYTRSRSMYFKPARFNTTPALSTSNDVRILIEEQDDENNNTTEEINPPTLTVTKTTNNYTDISAGEKYQIERWYRNNNEDEDY